MGSRRILYFGRRKAALACEHGILLPGLLGLLLLEAMARTRRDSIAIGPYFENEIPVSGAGPEHILERCFHSCLSSSIQPSEAVG